ncbi:MAG: DUF6290 family protein [Candidatus Nanohaloarchaea archaeon]
MGTVSIRMPDEEIEKLERLAEREGKSRSAFLREIAEEKIEKDSTSSLWDLAGILSDEEAEEMREVIKEKRKKTTEDLKKRAKEAFED